MHMQFIMKEKMDDGCMSVLVENLIFSRGKNGTEKLILDFCKLLIFNIWVSIREMNMNIAKRLRRI